MTASKSAVKPILMPQAGNTMEEGTILSWRVREGDMLNIGDIILEVETDKAAVEVEAVESGRLARIVVQEGETIEVLQPVAYLAESDADLEAYLNSQNEQEPSAAPETSTVADESSQAKAVVPESSAAVADGGRMILYAPHIRHPALSHGDWHTRIGYHLPQYVLENIESFRHVPRAVLGDLIQLRGTGTVRGGREVPRIEVVLATGIPREECRRMNLEYQDPLSIRLEDYEDREQEGILVVRKAGEILWRLAGKSHHEGSPSS